MAGFQELIKNFERTRDHMRQFFVYGYKSRGDFEEKSGRTYDNERRRIESWLAGYIQWGYTQKEKHVYISVDSRTIPQNPLYAAWRSKSFTDNDIQLHFFLPDLLWGQAEGLTAGQLCDQIAADYGVTLDSQTVRLKLKEYEELGLLQSKKQGKRLCYRLLPGPVCSAFIPPVPFKAGPLPLPHPAPPSPALAESSDRALRETTWADLLCAAAFFQGTAPFGFVGSTILACNDVENQWFRSKHLFIVHTLEDGVLADLLLAMRKQRKVAFENKSRRSGSTSTVSGVPLKIFVSTQTGRRYVCLYLEERRRFSNFRLDSIADVVLLDPCPDYEKRQGQLSQNLPLCWGVSFNGSHRTEEICLKLYVDEEKEPYILERLHREGRGGEVLKIRSHEYLYSGTFFDTNEMLAWVKTFTGRILDIQGSSRFAIGKLVHDLEKMYQMYQEDRTVSGQNRQTRTADDQAEKGSQAQTADRLAESGDCQTRAADRQAPIARQTYGSSQKATVSGARVFDKIYSCYYQAVRHILLEASQTPIDARRIRELSLQYGYLESSLTILPKLTEDGWHLLQRMTEGNGSGYTSLLKHPDALLPGRLPLTRLQRAWLRSLLSDPKIHLFLTAEEMEELSLWLAKEDPLYTQEDFHYFDRYLDGDDYDAPAYQEHFRLILQAIKEKKALLLAYENRKGVPQTFEAVPYQLVYSSREDKFRVCCARYSGRTFCRESVLNLRRIKACHLSKRPVPRALPLSGARSRSASPVVIQISGERNSLERCMLHFADHEKHTRFDEETKTWICSIYHAPGDETELLIQVLSFGPVIRVLGPDRFLEKIRDRVRRQHDLFYGTAG